MLEGQEEYVLENVIGAELRSSHFIDNSFFLEVVPIIIIYSKYQEDFNGLGVILCPNSAYFVHSLK